jgi:hypothetical protein
MLSFRIIKTKYLQTSFTFLSILSFLNAACSAAIIIDDFSTMQIVPGNSSSCISGPGIIGDERDVYVQSSTAIADINNTVFKQLYYTNGTGGLNYLNLVYDGMDSSYANHNYSGLGHIDLTDGGTYNGIALDFTQTSGHMASIAVTCWQGTDRMGHASELLMDNPQTIFLPFDDFDAEPWPASLSEQYNNDLSLIDFTDVGYIHIELAIWSSNGEFALDSITTAYGIPEPTTILLLGFGVVILRKRRH